MSCADVQTIQAGNGSKTQFSFDFPYLFKTEIEVSFWNATTKEWDVKATTDATYPWQVTDANPTIVEFTSTAPPLPATPVDPNESSVDNVRIRRTTSIDDIRALFSPGSAIRSDDLNKNFEQLRYAIQEANCQGVTDTVYQYLLDNYWDRFDNTLYDGDTWVSDDTKIATTEAIDDRVDGKIDDAIEGDILIDGTGLTKSATGGQVTLGIGANSVDFDRIKNSDIISYSEQDAGSPSPADNNIFTASAAARRFDTIVNAAEQSSAVNWEVGKTWLQNDSEKTVRIWDGSAWVAVASGGAFTTLPKVVYVDAVNGDDSLEGHRISNPKRTIKAAIQQINAETDEIGDGSVVIVAPGVYQEIAPIDIQKKNVSIIGQALRSCIVHPTPATEENTLFRLNSGSYVANLTLTGVKASGTRGGNSLDTDATYGLPTNQGWNFAFYPGATIVKSPYIANCTNFSDSEIDNSDLNAFNPRGGLGGDTDSAPTGGGILVDGSVVNSSSPLRSMVCDSYTHVGLDGPGIFVTNNGYCQATSSYAFFTHYHIKTLNGGQANLAASTTDFGRYGLIAQGRSSSSIFTATTTVTASDGATTFTIGAPSAAIGWHGSATRPQSNMVVDIGGNTYSIIGATANGAGWDVEISRPDPNNLSTNLGLDGAVSSGAAVSFFLRSMIASSGHTMEYVGSGTNYSALPENGGVPVEANEIVELTNGKVWAATTNHQGKFTVGPTFNVDQVTGYVNIANGAIGIEKLIENLDLNSYTLSDSTGDVTIDDTLDMNSNNIINVSGLTMDGDITMNAQSDVRFADSDSSNYVAIQAPATIGTNYTLTLPNSTGNAGEALITDANGNLSWSSNVTTTVDQIIEGDTKVEAIDTGSNGELQFTTDGTRAMTIDNNQQVDISQAGTAASPALIFNSDTNTGIYSPGADQVAVATNGTGRLFVDASGNVGVGGSPDQKLTVVGNIKGVNGSGQGIQFVNTATPYIQALGTSNINDLQISAQTIQFQTGTTYSTSERLRVTAAGLVGIGTSTPTAQLHVAGGSVRIDDTNIMFLNPNFGPGTMAVQGFSNVPLVFCTNNTEKVRIDGGGTFRVKGAGTAGVNDAVQLNGSAPANSLLLDASGRLLVGTASSTGTTRAVFAGSTFSDTSLSIVQFARGSANPVANDDLARLEFTDSNAGIGARIEASADGNWATGNYPGRLVFSTTADGASSPTERLRITSAGLVGIGTSVPATPLDVVGNIRAVTSTTSATTVRIGNTGNNVFLGVESSTGGSNITGSTAYAGTITSNGPIQFSTVNGGSVQATLDASGRLGLGTTSPGYTLDVNGTISTSSTIRAASTGVFTVFPAGVSGSWTGSGFALASEAGTAPIGFLQGASERARIDSSGRLLVGTSSAPADSTLVVKSVYGANQPANIYFTSYDTAPSSGGSLGLIKFSDSGQTTAAQIQCSRDGGTWTSGSSQPTRLVFTTTADGSSSPTERIRINSYGNVIINATSGYAYPGVYLKAGSTSSAEYCFISQNSAAQNIFLLRNNTYVESPGIYNLTTGSAANVHVASTGTLGRSVSSIKYKTDVETLEDSYADAILNIRPVWYRSIAGEDRRDWGHWGFIAEEVHAVDPRLTFLKTEEQVIDENGLPSGTVLLDEPEVEGVQYDRFVPHLVNLIKRQRDQIEALEARVAALEAS